MNNLNSRKYKEATIEETFENAINYRRSYKNDLARVYQYEYALYEVIAEMFGKVVNRSETIKSMKLYFMELPDIKNISTKEETNNSLGGKAGRSIKEGANIGVKEGTNSSLEGKVGGSIKEGANLSVKEGTGDLKVRERRSRESVLSEMRSLVNKYVVGNICFPAMNNCMAEVIARKEENKTHMLIFTDGIYGFSLKIRYGKKRYPDRIEVKDHSPSGRTDPEPTDHSPSRSIDPEPTDHSPSGRTDPESTDHSPSRKTDPEPTNDKGKKERGTETSAA